MATSSKELHISHVYNMYSGRIDSAEKYLERGDRRRERIKRQLTDAYLNKKKYLVCPFCYAPLYIKAGTKRPHFSHYSKAVEYKFCPLKEQEKHYSLTEIKALQYDGLQESVRHKYLKNKIGEILDLDKDCTNTLIDKCYTNREKEERRRPDIQTTYKKKSVLFEIQLSKEFITVISGRESYYRSKGAFLIWLFDSYSIPDLMNQSMKDIFYANNSHIFFIDTKSLQKSFESKKLYLYTMYNTPYINENMQISNNITFKEITIDDIIFNEESVTAYVYPYDEKFNELRRDIIYTKLINFLLRDDTEGLHNYLHNISDIKESFDFDLPSFIEFMLSAQKGTDILGRGTEKFHARYSQLLNPLGGGKKKQWLLYFYSILKYNKNNFVKEKSIQKCKKLLKEFQQNPSNDSVAFLHPTKQCESLFAFLFPQEYQKFLELIKWTGISWNGIDITHFESLDLY